MRKLIILAALLALAGCPKKSPEGTKVYDLPQQTNTRIQQGTTIAKAEVEKAKPHADPIGQAHLDSAASVLKLVFDASVLQSKQLDDAQVAVAQLQKEFDAYRAAEPLKRWLQLAAFCFVVLSVICAVIYLKTWRAMWAEGAGICAVCASGCVAAVRFMSTLEWIGLTIFITAIVVGAILLYRRVRLWYAAKNVITSVDRAYDAGLLKWDDAADTFLRKEQTRAARALVDVVQDEESR